MHRVLLSFCVLLEIPLLTQAAWISPSSWSISVDGTANGPPGSDTFSQTENAANAFGTRTVAGVADAHGTDPNGIPDGTQSSASAEATVDASSISFRSQMNFDHGTALGFSSAAGAQAQFTFEVTHEVMTSLELTAGGAHRAAHATLKDAADVTVWDVFVPELDIGIIWNEEMLPAEFPFRRSWMLTTGVYTLSLGHSTVPLVGTGGPSNFEFRLVPEPSAISLLWLASLAAVWLGRLRLKYFERLSALRRSDEWSATLRTDDAAASQASAPAVGSGTQAPAIGCQTTPLR